MNQTSTSVREPLHVSGVINALDQESRTRRLVCFALVGVMALAFFAVSYRFWVPVHPGVDQNGYLVGGKMLAQHGSMAYQPRRVEDGAIDPLQFVGRMWVGFDLGTAKERYYPKYPLGLPLIYAGALTLGGEKHGVDLAYLVSPVAMTLSLIGSFLLARLLLGSVPSLFVTLLISTSPVTISLVNNPNSHAVSLLFVVWGMYLAVRWWLMGGWWVALLSGLLVGSAVSVRYSEGTLVLPLAIVALFRLGQVGWRDRSTWKGAIALGLGWTAPVVALLWHNRVAMGAWTGYDPTNESTGFAWKYFADNWDTMLRLMYQTGITLVFPMAIAGLAAGFVWNWRVATFLAAWAVPCLLLYTAYYWAPEGLNIGYTRFFLTIFPALGISAFGLLLWPVSHLPDADDKIRRRLKLGGVFGLAMVTFLSIPLGIANIEQSVQADIASRHNLKYRADCVMAAVPAGSVMVCEDVGLVHHLQLASDYVLYSPEVFMRAVLDRFGERNLDEPNGLDPGRVKYLLKVFDGKTQQDMDTIRDDMIVNALRAGKRVFIFSQSAGGGTGGGAGMGAGAGAGGRANLGLGAGAGAGAGARANAGAGRRLPGWRGWDFNKLELSLMYSGTDPVAMPRNNPLARFGIAAVGRDRTPTTLPLATWQINEVLLKPPATQPVVVRQATTRPAATRPTGGRRL